MKEYKEFFAITERQDNYLTSMEKEIDTVNLKQYCDDLGIWIGVLGYEDDIDWIFEPRYFFLSAEDRNLFLLSYSDWFTVHEPSNHEFILAQMEMDRKNVR
jgi:hypothetical protein